MLRETLKQEIDQLSGSQLKKVADFVTSIKTQAQQLTQSVPFWQRATPAERSQDFCTWVAQLPKQGISLSDSAFDRDSVYEE